MMDTRAGRIRRANRARASARRLDREQYRFNACDRCGGPLQEREYLLGVCRGCWEAERPVEVGKVRRAL